MTVLENTQKSHRRGKFSSTFWINFRPLSVDLHVQTGNSHGQRQGRSLVGSAGPVATETRGTCVSPEQEGAFPSPAAPCSVPALLSTCVSMSSLSPEGSLCPEVLQATCVRETQLPRALPVATTKYVEFVRNDKISINVQTQKGFLPVDLFSYPLHFIWVSAQRLLLVGVDTDTVKQVTVNSAASSEGGAQGVRASLLPWDFEALQF